MLFNKNENSFNHKKQQHQQQHWCWIIVWMPVYKNKDIIKLRKDKNKTKKQAEMITGRHYF